LAAKVWNLAGEWRRRVRIDSVASAEKPARAARPEIYLPFKRVTLADEVVRTLFEEYEAHRRGPRSHEETGWVLLGLREPSEAIVLATLPAGTESKAGVAHVRFNSAGQAMGSRIVRQSDRRLTILGVVHTHPGSLRHPSDGDYRGDIRWVKCLRGREGIFGICTADGEPSGRTLYGRQPKPHVQTLGRLCLSWYSLAENDSAYRPLDYAMTIGPDLARPLHDVWSVIESHADRLDRLCRQQGGALFEVAPGLNGPALLVNFPLAEPGDAVRVLLEGEQVRYYLWRGGNLLSADIAEARVDRGLYVLLAELATQS
jgi:proteasome lid subunit RPN8/RPN11